MSASSAGDGQPPPKRHQGPRAWQRNDDEKRFAGAQLLEELLGLYGKCRLTAQTFCKLCHLAHVAGVTGGAFQDYGFLGKDAQRHLDVLLPKPGELYMQKVPMNLKKSHSRSEGIVPMKVLWSSIEAEIKNDPTMLQRLDNPSLDQLNVVDTPLFKSNPTVTQASERPIPVSVYMDGVQFIQQAAGRSESVTGWWLENNVTGRRHFIGSIKSGDLCGCGCRSWCSIQPIMSRIEWFLKGLQDGVVPTKHPDGTPYTPDTECMQPGSKLSRRCVLMHIKGDWSEHVHTLGLASWSQSASPCQFCSLNRDQIAEMGHELCVQVPNWRLRTAADYEKSCQRCEVCVRLTSRGDVQKLSEALKWKKDSKTAGGLVAYKSVEVAGTQVQSGDRLEPSESLGDIGKLQCVRVPCVVKLWRPTIVDGKCVDPVTHRCPLFSKYLNTSPAVNLAIDALHTVSLGVSVKFVSASLWRVLFADVWGIGGDTEKILKTSITLLRTELDRFQKDPRHGIDPSRRVENLTLAMLGRRKKCNVQDLFRFFGWEHVG